MNHQNTGENGAKYAKYPKTSQEPFGRRAMRPESCSVQQRQRKFAGHKFSPCDGLAALPPLGCPAIASYKKKTPLAENKMQNNEFDSKGDTGGQEFAVKRERVRARTNRGVASPTRANAKVWLAPAL